MASKLVDAFGLLALFAISSVAAQSCLGPAAPAKYRFMWAYELKDPNPSPAYIAQVKAAYIKYTSKCKGLVRYGGDVSVFTTPAQFGFASPPATGKFPTFGAYSDWTTLEDAAACVANGKKDGTLDVLRAFAKSSVRTVIDLTKEGGLWTPLPFAKCSPDSNAPAAYRYQFWYELKDNTVATVQNHIKLQKAIVGQVATKPIRLGTGADVVDDVTVWKTPSTADYGGFIDFATKEDLTKYLSEKVPARTSQRSNAKVSYRVVIPLQAVAAVGPAGAKAAAVVTTGH